MNWRLFALGGVGLAFFHHAAMAQSNWNAAADFSLSGNPNGQWSYNVRYGGLKAESAILPMVIPSGCFAFSGVACRITTDYGSGVGINTTGAPINEYGVTIPVDALVLQPAVVADLGCTCLKPTSADVTWAAPEGGNYSLSGSVSLVLPKYQGSFKFPAEVGILLNKRVLERKVFFREKTFDISFNESLRAGDRISIVAVGAGNALVVLKLNIAKQP